jgi:streptogramin lyase
MGYATEMNIPLPTSSNKKRQGMRHRFQADGYRRSRCRTSRLARSVQAGVSLLAVASLGLWPAAASAAKFHTFSLGHSANTNALTAGPDGALWVTEGNVESPGGRIVRIAATGKRSVYRLPGPGTPEEITSGRDGALWFIERNGFRSSDDYIGRITTTGKFRAFRLPGAPNVQLAGIVSGPRRAVWFSELVGPLFGRQSSAIASITSAGRVSAVSLGPNTASQSVSVFDLAADADGILWFIGVELRADHPFNNLSGLTTDLLFATPAGHSGLAFENPTSDFCRITAGPEGIWFTDRGGPNERPPGPPAIWRQLNGGHAQMHALPSGHSPCDIVYAAGIVWFTDGNMIGRITQPASHHPRFTEFRVPGAKPSPADLANLGGKVWFLESDRRTIGSLTP